MDVQVLTQAIGMTASALIFYMLSRWEKRRREKFILASTAVMAKIVGEVQTNGSGMYIVEFEDKKGEKHRVHYPRSRRGTPLKAGQKVILRYDPNDINMMMIDEDDSNTMMQRIYVLMAQVILAAMLLRVIPLL